MNTLEFEKIIEENTELLGNEMFTYLIGELENKEIDENRMKFIVSEIKKAKSSLERITKLKTAGSKIYAEGINKAKGIQTKIKKEVLNNKRKKEKKDHENEIRDAENLVSNL